MRQRVIHKADVAAVLEAARQRAGQAQAVIDLAEQEHPAVTGEIAGGKLDDDPARPQVGKEQRLIRTDCRRSESGGQ